MNINQDRKLGYICQIESKLITTTELDDILLLIIQLDKSFPSYIVRENCGICYFEDLHTTEFGKDIDSDHMLLLYFRNPKYDSVKDCEEGVEWKNIKYGYGISIPFIKQGWFNLTVEEIISNTIKYLKEKYIYEPDNLIIWLAKLFKQTD